MTGGRVLTLAAALLLAACPTPQPASPYDLPPKTSGGIKSTQAPPAVSLTLTVEAIDPPDDAELAAAVEDAIAFSHYADLNACEIPSKGWETGFQVGTVGIGFTLDPDGTTREVSAVLTTGDPAETFTGCLVEAVRGMLLADVALEEPATFHLMLKYGE